eukprot:12748630-Alexandrium_andersonii.AAC.1
MSTRSSLVLTRASLPRSPDRRRPLGHARLPFGLDMVRNEPEPVRLLDMPRRPVRMRDNTL